MIGISPLRRDGHLHELGVEALVDGALDDEALGVAEAHLAACPACLAAVGAARRARATPLPPRRAAPAANRGWTAWLASLSALAAAGLVALAVPGAPVDPGAADADGFTTKGARLRVEVWADEGDHARRLKDRDRARADDRLGFRVASAQPGHLMIVGVDDAGQPWLGYPQHTDGLSAAVRPEGRTEDLEAAVRLDGHDGHERILGLLCPAPFSFDDVTAALGEASAHTTADAPLPTLRPGCAQTELRVEKVVE